MSERESEQIKLADWEHARRHLHNLKDAYAELVCVPGVNVTFVLGLIGQLSERLERGERTQELYDEIMGMK